MVHDRYELVMFVNDRLCGILRTSESRTAHLTVGSPTKLESPYTSGAALLSLEVTDTKCNFKLARP
jgi:hypothetical protein